jgi:hypothetical protein
VGFGRRTLSLLVVLGVLGIPALLLRAFCAGHSCDVEASATSEVPFCSLPQALRSRVDAGWREGRGPEVLAIAHDDFIIAGGSDYGQSRLRPQWPSGNLDAARVPIVFSGDGIGTSSIPPGTTLDRIAPTLAEVIEFERPFPEVRSGRPIPGVAAGEAPRLVLQVILKGVGSDDLEDDPNAWPYLEEMMSSGAATMDGDTGSLPLDPAAIVSTVGTGGLPRQHGITGSLVRNDGGELVRAFSERADSPIIATLSDDLDESQNQQPIIGLVGTSAGDRGAIGGEWYGRGDKDEVVIDPRDPEGAALEMLTHGFADDEFADVLAIALNGEIGRIDKALKRIVNAAVRVSEGSVAIAVVGTGSDATGDLDGAAIASDVDAGAGEPLVEAAVPGGLFVDQKMLAELELSEDVVIDEMARLTGPEGRLFADVFPAIAVSFARYC